MVSAGWNMDSLVRKRGKFLDYDITGDWVVDTKNQRGWIIRIVDGLETGSFWVMGGKIHRCGIEFRGKNARAILHIEGIQSTFKWPSAKQAIIDAMAKWEAEEREKPLDL